MNRAIGTIVIMAIQAETPAAKDDAISWYWTSSTPSGLPDTLRAGIRKATDSVFASRIS